MRPVRHDGEWWFAMEDVAAVLTEGPDPADAWQQLKEQELAACGTDLSELCRWLEMEPVTVTSAHGLKVEAATLEGILRIVQAIFSPKAEIFKRWLARVAAEPVAPRGYRTNLDTVFALLEDTATALIANRLDDQGNAQGRDSGDAARKAARIAGKVRERLQEDLGEKIETVKEVIS
ncbi:BRO family protein [Desulfurivibrio sp. D14AmB]|uniref:BRO family protein n=1 Tax=Desulfurivibrio sp. D14AmB TaxID=3374370 RepID=UPI00376EDD5D